MLSIKVVPQDRRRDLTILEIAFTDVDAIGPHKPNFDGKPVVESRRASARLSPMQLSAQLLDLRPQV